MIVMECQRPFGGCAAIPVDGDWMQLDIPDFAVLVFCGLKCLHAWVEYNIDSAHRVPTKFIEARLSGGTPQ